MNQRHFIFSLLILFLVYGTLQHFSQFFMAVNCCYDLLKLDPKEHLKAIFWAPRHSALSITTFSITTLSITTYSTQYNDIRHNDTLHKGLFLTLCLNDIQHNNTLHRVPLYAECRYAECRYAGHRSQDHHLGSLPFYILGSDKPVYIKGPFGFKMYLYVLQTSRA